MAGDALLSWSPNTEPLLEGYKVYYGTIPGVYSASIDVGNRTSYTVTGLGIGTYYFAITAYEASRIESGFSNEVSKTFTDVTPPVISAIVSSGLTADGVTIAWMTNELSDTQIHYGTTTAYGLSTGLNAALTTAHSQNLTGLLPSTTYHYRVISKDADGNLALSGDNTFNTFAAPDTAPPVLSSVTVTALGMNGATITWTTNEPADTQVEFGLTTVYGSSTAIDPSKTIAHSRQLTGLQGDTTYHFRAVSRDNAGNRAASPDQIFTTSSAPDAAPPVVSAVTAEGVTGESATVRWETSEPATTQVEYGTTTQYEQSTPLDAMLVGSHSQGLTRLLPGTLYHYRVKSMDAAGNLSISGDNIFTTNDTTPPADAGDFKAEPGNRQITLKWTNPPDSDFVGVRVRYRTDHFPDGFEDGELLGDFTGQPNENVSTVHSGLLNGVTYYYSASSYDRQGNHRLTVHASAAPLGNIEINASGNDGKPSESGAGGCSRLLPGDGKTSGPGQAADMVFLMGVLFWRLIRKYRLR